MDRKGSILIVDDGAGPRESLRMILQPMYEVHTVENGQEAIKFISQNKVDLVTLDLKMPGLSGIEVLQEIKKLQPDIEIIIVPGYGTLKNAQEAIRFGAVDLISKPFYAVDIIATVGKAFERRSYNLKIKGLIQQIQDLHSSFGENNQAKERFGTIANRRSREEED